MTTSPTRIYIARKPLQLVKTIWGIKSAYKDWPRLAFCDDDSALANMDAPEILPAGSTGRQDVFGGYYIVRETTTRRNPARVSFLA